MKISLLPGGDARPLFWFVVAAALLLRLWGIGYGLPYSYWIDEYHEVLRALELGSGGFNFARSTKGGLYLLLFVEYGVYFVVLKVAGIVHSTADFARIFVSDPTVFYLLGRATAAVMGTLTVIAAFGVGRVAYSRAAGIASAVFLAFNVLHVDLSHRIGVDVPMTLFATMSLYFGVKIVTDSSRRNYLLSALFAALATTTKLPGIALVLPLVIAHAYSVRSAGGGIRGWFANPRLWIAVGCFLLVLIATNPGIVGMTGLVSADSPESDASMDDDRSEDAEGGGSGDRTNLYLYYLGVLADAMGWPMFVVGLVSLGYALWKRTTPDMMLVSYALLNYAVFSSTSSDTLYYPRYALPIIVVVTILAARLLAEVAGRFPRPRIAIAALSVACIAWPVVRSVADVRALDRVDTRTIAKAWIEENIPEGSHILIEGLKIAPTKGTVQLRETPDAVMRRIDYWRVHEPKQARYLELMRGAPGGVGYELHFARINAMGTLEDYVTQGVRYFIVRPDYFQGSRRADASSGRLLEELRSNARVRLVKKFDGDTQTPPGPTIEIYRWQ